MIERSRRVALRTVLTAVFGVVGFILAVYALTGRFSDDEPPTLRRASYGAGGPTLTWLRLEVTVDDAPVPFFAAVPDEGDGLVINGIEELPVRIRRGERGAVALEVPRYASELSLAVGDVDVTGTWRVPGRNPATIIGTRVADGLPERRFPVRPEGPEARGEQADFSYVWRLDTGGRSGKAVFRQSDTGVVTGALILPGGGLGHVAGRVFGRRLLLSRFDGRHAVRVEMTMRPDGGGFTGVIHRLGEAPLPFTGEAADRVDLPAAVSEVSPRPTGGDVTGPAVVALLPLAHRLSHELVPLLSEVHALDGVEVIGVGLAPAEHRTLLERAFTEAHAVEWPLRAPWPGVDSVSESPVLLFVDRSGRVVARAAGLVGPAAVHDHREQANAVLGRARELAAP